MQYYVYQCDLVKGIEDLRTPLQTMLDLEQQLRGTIAGFLMPSFVVDLPEGGGKRLACSHEKYEYGVSYFKAPGLRGEKGQKEYRYYDPQPIEQTEEQQAHNSISRAHAEKLPVSPAMASAVPVPAHAEPLRTLAAGVRA
jgi:lysine 2,3-aminomutase